MMSFYFGILESVYEFIFSVYFLKTLTYLASLGKTVITDKLKENRTISCHLYHVACAIFLLEI